MRRLVLIQVLIVACSSLAIACDSYELIGGPNCDVTEQFIPVSDPAWREGKFGVFGSDLFRVHGSEGRESIVISRFSGAQYEELASQAFGRAGSLQYSELVRNREGDIFVAVADPRARGAIISLSHETDTASIWWQGSLGDHPRLNYIAELNQFAADDRWGYCLFDDQGQVLVEDKVNHAWSGVLGDSLLLSVDGVLRTYPAAATVIDKPGARLMVRSVAQVEADSLVVSLDEFVSGDRLVSVLKKSEGLRAIPDQES